MSIPAFLVPCAISPSAVDLSKYQTIRQSEGGEQLLPLMQQLSDLTEQFSAVVDSRLQESETDFLLAFQTHMVTVRGDLAALRRRADSSEAEERRDERVGVLKREVDWFKSECVRLNDTVKTKTRENRRLTEKLSGLHEEVKFLKTMVTKSALQVNVHPPTPPPASLPNAGIVLQQPAIVDSDLLNKAETLVAQDAHSHNLLAKELARTRRDLATHKQEHTNTQESWLLKVLEGLVEETDKERLTRTDKIGLIRRLLTNEKVLDELLNKNSKQHNV